MKRKGLSILLSALLVIILTVSFSVPVEASSVSDWQTFIAGSDATITKSNNNVNYFVPVDVHTWYDAIYTDSLIVRPSGDNFFIPSGTDATVKEYESLGYCYFRLAQLSSVNQSTYRARVRNLSVGYGSFSGLSEKTIIAGSPFFAIGSTSEVLSGHPLSVPWGSDGVYYFDAGYDYCYLWFCVPIAYYNNIGYKFTVNVTYSFDSVERRFNGTLDNINESINTQTDSLENGYDNSGLNQSNSNLSGAIADYDNTESQITDSSVANIDNAAFISPSSNATLLASISFTTSWLQSLFVNLGDWGLLVTVSLSLALGLMLIGWFKYR